LIIGSDYGLKRFIPSEEKRELGDLHTPYWNALKVEHGVGQRTDGVCKSVFDIPGFVASLRQLVETHDYGHTDVGLMFGVSRERVRQWCKELGIRKKYQGSSLRIWDAERGLFVAVEWKDVLEKARRKRREARIEKSRALWDRRRQAAVNKVRECGDRIGHAPYLKDVWPGQGGEFVKYCMAWGACRKRNGSYDYSSALDRMWAAAGYSCRPDGRKERPGRARFTDNEVLFYRERHRAGISITALAEGAGVHWNTIAKMVKGKTYTHVPMDDQKAG
jgi:hypothetical protein